jgi:hypothetical protein
MLQTLGGGLGKYLMRFGLDDEGTKVTARAVLDHRHRGRLGVFFASVITRLDNSAALGYGRP